MRYVLCLLLAGCAAHRPAAETATPMMTLPEHEQALAAEEARLEAASTDCVRACELVGNICALAERICKLAGEPGPDRADLARRCDSARERCRRARDRVAPHCPCPRN